jgi:putative sigma-54 modulation protein
MKLIIHAQDFELTPAIEQYLRQKLAKLQEFMQRVDDEPRLEVSFRVIGRHVDGDMFRVSATVQFRRQHIFSKEEGRDVYALIDTIEDELGRQIRTKKEKPFTRVKRGAQRVKDWIRSGLWGRE